MKTFILTYEILQASGTQTYSVQANSEAEAHQKYLNGEGECVGEDIEVGQVSEEPINAEIEEA